MKTQSKVKTMNDGNDKNTRLERDSIGVLEVPVGAYYGVQSLRGAENFHITGRMMNDKFIKNIARIKRAGARVNGKHGSIPLEISKVIVRVCDEILEGKFQEEFITDAVQGGAGTSVNMNANEVIANRATELLGGKLGEYICHPNDHVNGSQSTNDVIPTAGKLTVLELSKDLLQSLDELIASFKNKSVEFDGILKMGRTQLQDAVPIRLGQEFGAYATALQRSRRLIANAVEEMKFVNIGGSAIGTSVNVKKGYLDDITLALSEEVGITLESAEDLIDGTQNIDGFATVSSALRTCALSLSKICNDLRLMSSGPKTGLNEIQLPARQNGSSIMPGKVNPVIPEVVSQVAFLVVGNDVTIAMAVEAGQLELNAFEPVIFYKLFESLTCLSNAMKTLKTNCVDGIVANEGRCQELLHSSVGVVTALCPYLGYKKSAELAKEALKKNMRVKDLILQYGLMEEKQLDELLDPYSMT